MKKQVTWTLGSGKEATYTIELILSKEINLDGDKSTVSCCEINATFDIPGAGFIPGDMIIEKQMTINGTTIAALAGNKVGLRPEVYAAIKAAKAEIEAAPEWQAKQANIKRNELDNKALWSARKKNGYCPKCHSYCFGDCEAN